MIGSRHILPLGMLLSTGAAHAGEDALYDPMPPLGSAFVRAVDCRKAAAAIDVRVGATSFGKLQPAEAGPYRVVAPGALKATFGATGTADVVVEPGSFYTLVVRDGTAPTPFLVDKPNSNLSRAQITLYNLTDAPAVSLKLADGSAAVVEAVAPGQQAGRLVNAVTVDLGLWIGAQAGQVLPGRELQRGGAYSVLVCPAAEGARVTWVENTTTTR